MLYVPHLVSDANASHPHLNAVPVSGQYLDKNRLKQYQRAFIAADLVDGKVVLVNPKPHQAAGLCQVNTAYVYAAKRVAHSSLRADAENGRLPLNVAAHHCRPLVSQLLALWTACSADERVEFARKADPERIFEVIEIAIGVSDGGVS
jgi:hypothetical protein